MEDEVKIICHYLKDGMIAEQMTISYHDLTNTITISVNRLENSYCINKDRLLEAINFLCLRS
jgi:hypothetical protein